MTVIASGEGERMAVPKLRVSLQNDLTPKDEDFASKDISVGLFRYQGPLKKSRSNPRNLDENEKLSIVIHRTDLPQLPTVADAAPNASTSSNTTKNLRRPIIRSLPRQLVSSAATSSSSNNVPHAQQQNASKLRSNDAQTTLLVRNLHESVRAKDLLLKVFHDCDILSAVVLTDEHGRSIGSAEVVFASKEEAEQALAKHNNGSLLGVRMKMSIVGREVDSIASSAPSQLSTPSTNAQTFSTSSDTKQQAPPATATATALAPETKSTTITSTTHRLKRKSMDTSTSHAPIALTAPSPSPPTTVVVVPKSAAKATSTSNFNNNNESSIAPSSAAPSKRIRLTGRNDQKQTIAAKQATELKGAPHTVLHPNHQMESKKTTGPSILTIKKGGGQTKKFVRTNSKSVTSTSPRSAPTPPTKQSIATSRTTTTQSQEPVFMVTL